MQNNKDFHSFFESELKPLLQPLENYRVKRIKIFKRCIYFAIVAILILIVCFFSDNRIIVISGVLFVVLACGLAYESISITNLNLRKDYKHKILPRILGFIFSEFEYIPQQKLSKTVFEKSLLFPKAINTILGEDFMRFQIDNVDLMFCEAEVYSYGPSSKMFHGIFISATFNKSFTSKTFIFPQKATSYFRKLKFKILGSSYRVKLEDPEFDREFIVLSEDQIESRYILTTSLMQRILEYKKKLKVEIAFSFISERLYCSIPNSTNLFEPAIFDSFLDFNFILKSYEPIMLYTSIVKDLNLNLRIWTKQ